MAEKVTRVANHTLILHTKNAKGEVTEKRTIAPGEAFDATQDEIDGLHKSHPNATREPINEVVRRPVAVVQPVVLPDAMEPGSAEAQRVALQGNPNLTTHTGNGTDANTGADEDDSI